MFVKSVGQIGRQRNDRRVIREVGCPMALAVGMANSEVEFVFPTSEEMGHPVFDVSPNTGPPRPTQRSRLGLGSFGLPA